jgi:hypothetical protein
MAPTTAQLTSQRADVKCAATWWKPPLSTRITSRGGSQYTVIMFICLLHRKTNFVGSFTALRTHSAPSSILEAHQMCVKGGTKQVFLDCDSVGIGLYKHFKNGWK